ncbi:MAG: hypothetical protein CVT67_00345 [Actinobacteria bacterium HGW-Actinobacteria-7]|jgi:hypothetical protein|nr:MAG: hypothetical protein CVT67_00345 [Actinobacteria bacterium HGW-Actinobacteria-7]
MRIIGAASEFWRLRLTKVDTTDELDFEWHEDILYRAPHPTTAGDLEVWYVEAIRLDDYEAIVALGTFRNRLDAEDFLERANEDLAAMTKTQFETAYLTPLPPADEAMRPDGSSD